MVNLWRDVRGGSAFPKKITYRATSPLYAGEKYRVVMDEEKDKVTEVNYSQLWEGWNVSRRSRASDSFTSTSSDQVDGISKPRLGKLRMQDTSIGGVFVTLAAARVRSHDSRSGGLE